MGDQVDSKRVRDIKIKSGIVKRLAKEKISYEKEFEKQQQKVDGMKKMENCDEYDIRKQQEVLDETRKMIPDCERRLVAAWDDLSRLVDSESDLKETEEYQQAEETLKETKAVCGQ